MQTGCRTGSLAALVILFLSMQVQGGDQVDTANNFREMPFMPNWRLVEAIRPKFDVFHPQGLVKVGERFYVSSVQVVEKTTRVMNWKTGRDRTAGRGVGHLFEFDAEGNPLRHMTLGEGDMYHPGGIDFDGTWLWVPVSEYRPKSRSVIYKVNPATWEAVEVFRVPDHVGAIVFNREDQTVVGLSWGARFFYEWTAAGKLLRKAQNDFHDIAYQDCKYVNGPAMLCGGVYSNARGGIELLDLLDFSKIRGIWSVPRTRNKTLMTRNPMTFDWKGGRLLYYFLPEDRNAVLYVYEVR